MGFGVWGLGFGVWGLGSGVWGSGLKFPGSRFRVRVSGPGFGVPGLAIRVSGFDWVWTFGRWGTQEGFDVIVFFLPFKEFLGVLV